MAKVLIVDDDKETISLLERIVAIKGHQPSSATNSVSAVEAAHSINPDVILMDILMPVMNGFKATQIIRAIEGYRNKRTGTHKLPIPIIALTANAMKGDKEACLAAGMNSYISKPFKHEDLVDALRNIFQK